MTPEEKVKVAKLVSRTAHRGQMDKSGKPYYLHPETVASFVTDPEDQVCAYLHDVLEDTDVTYEELLEVFGEETMKVLTLLTHRDEDDYFTYIDKIKTNERAVRVKLADLKHNMDLSRMPNPTEKDYKRLEKYKRAVEELTH